jgi:hypothetical protein
MRTVAPSLEQVGKVEQKNALRHVAAEHRKPVVHPECVSAARRAPGRAQEANVRHIFGAAVGNRAGIAKPW